MGSQLFCWVAETGLGFTASAEKGATPSLLGQKEMAED